MIEFKKDTEFLSRYPKAMEGLLEIKQSFRTQTGKAYGPEFIDMGTAIGEELLNVIQSEIISDDAAFEGKR